MKSFFTSATNPTGAPPFYPYGREGRNEIPDPPKGNNFARRILYTFAASPYKTPVNRINFLIRTRLLPSRSRFTLPLPPTLSFSLTTKLINNWTFHLASVAIVPCHQDVFVIPDEPFGQPQHLSRIGKNSHRCREGLSSPRPRCVRYPWQLLHRNIWKGKRKKKKKKNVEERTTFPFSFLTETNATSRKETGDWSAYCARSLTSGWETNENTVHSFFKFPHHTYYTPSEREKMLLSWNFTRWKSTNYCCYYFYLTLYKIYKTL